MFGINKADLSTLSSYPKLFRNQLLGDCMHIYIDGHDDDENDDADNDD